MSDDKREIYTFRIAVPEGFTVYDVEAAIKRLRPVHTDADNLKTYGKVLWTSILTEEGLQAEAERLKRAEYWSDVQSIVDSVKSSILDGEIDDREALIEYVQQSVDGSGRVIYTARAKEGLDYSNNASAYVDNYGSDGATEDGEMAWSKLMYAALEADVLEELGDDIANADGFCETCRKAGHIVVVGSNGDLCDDHENEADETETETEDEAHDDSNEAIRARLSADGNVCPKCGKAYPYGDPRAVTGQPCFDCESPAE